MKKLNLRPFLKNSILILVTTALLAFFVFANTVGTLSIADENEAASEAEAEASENMLIDDGITLLSEGTGTEPDTNEPETTPESSDDSSSPDGATEPGGEDEPNTVGDTEETPEGTTEEEVEEEATEERPHHDEITEDTVAVIYYTYDNEDYTRQFTSLVEAFSGAYEIYSIFQQAGVGSFIPTIKLYGDVSISSPIEVVNVFPFVFDFNGHNISFATGGYLNVGSAAATFTDSAGGQINLTDRAENTRPGGINGQSGNLIYSSRGDISFEGGCYVAQAGSIVSGARYVTVSNAYLFTGDSYTVDNCLKLTINGGFFQYGTSPCDSSVCTLVLPGANILTQKTILLGGNETTGYGLGNAIFKLTVLKLGEENANNPTYSYSTFDTAFSKAAEFSSTEDGATVKIEISDVNVEAVTLSKTYNLSTAAGGVAPTVEIENIKFKRDTYDKTLFNVLSGTLYFKDCTVNGFISDTSISEGSMIIVENGATLKLSGSSEKGTKIEKNTGLLGAISGDPCAGVFLKTGSHIDIDGYVIVNNNVAYKDKTESSPAVSSPCNVYLDGTADIILSGPTYKTQTNLIGLNQGTTTISDGTIVGHLSAGYISELSKLEVPVVDLSAFFMDQIINYKLVYEKTDHTLRWAMESVYLPEAGVLRLEYLILFIGLLGFVFRNVSWIKGKEDAERYIMILSLCCLVCGCALGLYHIRSEQLLVSRNQQIAEKLTAEMENKSRQGAVILNDQDDEDVIEVETVEKSMVPQDGREYIGLIEISDLDIKLPVLKDYSDADMKTTPCVYYGCVENNNIVIVGHNYDSQFGDFNKLSNVGFDVKLTLLDGSEYLYRASAVEQLEPTDISEMLAGDWDMTLFTCSYNGEKRITIRCDLVR